MESQFSFALVSYFCLLFSLSVHEAAHAAASNWCGDPSARLMGRLTLNPIKHIDPIGTVVMPLLMMFSGIPYLFGWAKPVPFNPRNLGNVRRDPVIIALAGPFSNLFIGIGGIIVFRILIMLNAAMPDNQIILMLALITLQMVMVNFLLMLFNVIPVPPLDGHYVLHYFLPPSGQKVMESIGPFGIIIAIFLARPWLGFALPLVMSLALFGALWGQYEAGEALLDAAMGVLG